MTRILSFDAEHDYSAKDAITLAVRLRHGGRVVDFDASVDAGSTFCIFKRGHAELLNLNVAAGTPLRIGTATGVFMAYGHDLTLESLGMTFDTTVYFAEHEGLPP